MDHFNAYRWQGKMLHPKKKEQNAFYQQFVFKDGFGFFEVSHEVLADWLPHPSIMFWTHLNKVHKCAAPLSVNLSVIGIYPKSTSQNTAKKMIKAMYQVTAKKKIKAMFEKVFENAQDHKSSSKCIDDYATIAIFVSTGPRKLTNKETIFGKKSAQNNLMCVATLTFIPHPSKHLKVLWLGVTNVPTFLNQSMGTWQRNGLGYYLMLVLIQHQVSSSNADPKVYLQCSRNEPSFNFYTQIGFIPCLPDDEEIEDLSILPAHAHTGDSVFVNLVLIENTLRKAGLSRIDCSLSDTEVEQSAPPSSSSLVYCRFPPSKFTSVANLVEACCKGLSIVELLGLSCIQPEHQTFYKPMGYAGRGFVKGDTRIKFDPTTFVASSTIELVFGYLLRLGVHDEFVTVVPLQIT
jgi:hypothetical protein